MLVKILHEVWALDTAHINLLCAFVADILSLSPIYHKPLDSPGWTLKHVLLPM